MRVLIINKYHKVTGGADRYALDLARLLMHHGHPVAFVAMEQPDNWPADYPLYTVPAGLTHSTWRGARARDRVAAYAHGLYNRQAAETVAQAITAFRPDVVHCQNIFYQLSPSAIHAARRMGVPVVQTLHDYQPVCANNTLFTGGRICEACRRNSGDTLLNSRGSGRSRPPSRVVKRLSRVSPKFSILRNRCYNDDTAASFLAFSAKVVHTVTGIYPGGVQRFISPSRFLKEKIESFGVPMAPIEHVNNFLDLARYEPRFDPGDYLLFFGQLLKHKGIYTLVEALGSARMNLPMTIAGTGPETDNLRRRIEQLGLENVALVGYKTGQELLDLIRGARCVVVPSEWYENQPYAVLESLALGKPVAAAAIGGIPELINDDVGALFAPGDSADLARKLAALVSDTDRLRRMGEAARRKVTRDHDPDDHLQRLLDVYRHASGETSEAALQGET